MDQALRSPMVCVENAIATDVGVLVIEAVIGRYGHCGVLRGRWGAQTGGGGGYIACGQRIKRPQDLNLDGQTEAELSAQQPRKESKISDGRLPGLQWWLQGDPGFKNA